jgi:hypothetical protein
MGFCLFLQLRYSLIFKGIQETLEPVSFSKLLLMQVKVDPDFIGCHSVTRGLAQKISDQQFDMLRDPIRELSWVAINQSLDCLGS